MYSRLGDQPNDSMSTGSQLNFAIFVMRVWATSLTVFLHRDMGSRYLGFNAIGVFIFVPCYTVFWRGYDIGPLLLFLLAYFLMVLVTRAAVLTRHGELVHSYYDGWPRLLNPEARMTELQCKRYVEPLLVIAFGYLVNEWNRPLGVYFMLGAGAMATCGMVVRAINNNRVLDLQDAIIDQSQLADRIRNNR